MSPGADDEPVPGPAESPATLWGGRFREPPAETLWRFTVDPSDHRLLTHDIRGSRAHVAMLGERGILTAHEAASLDAALAQVAAEAGAGDFVVLDTDEDVHTAVERRVVELVGPVGGKLHTGRSRNDQVSLDLRLYLVEAVDRHVAGLCRLVSAVVSQAAGHAATVVAAYTHLQQAQPVPLGHHLLAHAWMLTRDVARFDSARRSIAISPLGAGAGAGSSLPLDPAAVASRLGLGGVFANSMDAVGSRDFVSDFVFACAQTMTDLSRLAEELVLWSTAEFGWVDLGDPLTTGSSALPQKRNPDMAELVRGRTATVIGDLTAVLALQKGLPLTYNRDLQEDKTIAFHADDTVSGAVAATSAMVAGAGFDPPRPGPDVLALDLAEVLVGRGIPFREAHASVGRLVGDLAVEGRSLVDATAADLAAADPRFAAADLRVLDLERSLGRRSTRGAGSTRSVEMQVATLREWLAGRAADGSGVEVEEPANPVGAPGEPAEPGE